MSEEYLNIIRETIYLGTAITILKDSHYAKKQLLNKQQLLTEMMSQLSPYPGEYDEEETRMSEWLDKAIENRSFRVKNGFVFRNHLQGKSNPILEMADSIKSTHKKSYSDLLNLKDIKIDCLGTVEDY